MTNALVLEEQKIQCHKRTIGPFKYQCVDIFCLPRHWCQSVIRLIAASDFRKAVVPTVKLMGVVEAPKTYDET